jgi:hypothetical protein
MSHVLLVSQICLALIISPAFAATYVIKPDGSGDFATIQAAILAAQDWDIIELADGVFQGDGNRDIVYGGKSLTVRSQSGDPEDCIIDCSDSRVEYHRGFYFQDGEDSNARLENVTIQNGTAGGDD